MQFPRLITAMVTPFKGENVDLKGFETNIHYQLEQGVKGILVLGTTGESPTLTAEERRSIITTAAKVVNKKIPLFVGTGTNATRTTIELTQEAEQLGADCALVITPYYNRPAQEGIYQHFASLCEATTIPICIYNHPKRTGQHIEFETLKRMASLPHIIGIKEVSGNLHHCADIVKEISSKHENFMIWSGDDILTLPMMSIGCHGVVSIVSNIIPHHMFKMIDKASEGDFTSARDLFYTMLPFLNALEVETNPIPIKAAMNLCNMPSGPCRLPMTEMSDENQKMLQKALLDVCIQESATAL